MKAVTKVEVTYNVPNKVNKQEQGIIEGRILSVIMYPTASVIYQYNIKNGTSLLSGTKNIDTETANAILNANPIDSMQKAEQIFYATLKSEMAITFGVSQSDIEIEL